MYLAASAAGNSACLSRQVGAALTDQSGEVISVGWNDVPKAGGNLYTSDGSSTDEDDKRCWNLDGGTCFNDAEKRITAELLADDLVRNEIIKPEAKQDVIKIILEKSKVKDLIEFSRSIHAEMHAILLGSQMAGKKVRDGKLFCTTYPCHSCARHIIAAGIKEVYYIEPYRKSLATKLHDDSITESEEMTSKVRLLPYEGVAPARYFKLFRSEADRKLNGKLNLNSSKTASPTIKMTMVALPALEGVVVDSLRSKKLIDSGNQTSKEGATSNGKANP
jgi:deoxycytidylate deaminase